MFLEVVVDGLSGVWFIGLGKLVRLGVIFAFHGLESVEAYLGRLVFLNLGELFRKQIEKDVVFLR